MTSFWLAAVFAAAHFCEQPIQLMNKDEYSSKGGNFSILFPGKPKESSDTAKGPDGVVKVFAATYSDGDGNVFLVSYSDLPPESTKPEKLDALFEGLREGAKGEKGRVLEDEKKDHELGPGKLPARKFVMSFEMKDDKKKGLKLRVIIAGQRLYQIAASGSWDFINKSKEPDKFIDSFKIISK